MLTAKKALVKARKLFGKTGAVKCDPRQRTNHADRLAARERARVLTPLIKTETDKAKKKELEIKQRNEWWNASKYEFSIGRVMLGMFFEVRGEGDTWEEAFLDYERKDAYDHDRWYHSDPKKPCTECARAKAAAERAARQSAAD